MSDNRKEPDRIYGRIRIGDEVFSGVISGRKATENIIRAFERPSSAMKKATKYKNGVVVEK